MKVPRARIFFIRRTRNCRIRFDAAAAAGAHATESLRMSLIRFCTRTAYGSKFDLRFRNGGRVVSDGGYRGALVYILLEHVRVRPGLKYQRHYIPIGKRKRVETSRMPSHRKRKEWLHITIKIMATCMLVYQFRQRQVVAGKDTYTSAQP